MNDSYMMVFLVGFAAGLLIAIAAVVAVSGRGGQTVVVAPPQPRYEESGCGGIVLMAVMALAAVLFLALLAG